MIRRYMLRWVSGCQVSFDTISSSTCCRTSLFGWVSLMGDFGWLDEWSWWVRLVGSEIGWMSEFDVWGWLDEWSCWVRLVGWVSLTGMRLVQSWSTTTLIPHYHLLKAQRPYHAHAHAHAPSLTITTSPDGRSFNQFHTSNSHIQPISPNNFTHPTNLTHQTHTYNQSHPSTSLIQPTKVTHQTHSSKQTRPTTGTTTDCVKTHLATTDPTKHVAPSSAESCQIIPEKKNFFSKKLK